MAKVRAASSDTLNDVFGMWRRGTGGMGSNVRRRRSEARALETDVRARRGRPRARVTCSDRARATRCPRPGRGSGVQGSGAGDGSGATVAVSTTFCSRATAAEPSATAWWSLTTTAMRSPRSPSTTRMAHRGRSRGSEVPAKAPMAAARERSSPGGSSTTLSRCRARSKSGSSTQTGWPSPKGTATIRRRNGGSCTRSWPRTWVSVAKEKPSGRAETSETATLIVCMCAVDVSE